jgi:hypothetical protein
MTLLKEVFNSTKELEWLVDTDHMKMAGFELNDDEYILQLSMQPINLSSKTLNMLNFGFIMNGEMELTGKFKAPTVFGIIMNNIPKVIKEMNPDFIVFGSMSSGKSEHKMRLYNMIANKYSKGSDYKTEYKNVKAKTHEFTILSKCELTEEDLEKIKERISIYL